MGDVSQLVCKDVEGHLTMKHFRSVETQMKYATDTQIIGMYAGAKLVLFSSFSGLDVYYCRNKEYILIELINSTGTICQS
jgi:hypothetical protein